MVILESLDTSVFDIGQTPIPVSDLVSLVVATGRASQRRRNPIDPEDRVPHARAAALIAQNLDTLDEPVYGGVCRNPLQRRLSEIKVGRHVILKDFAKFHVGSRSRKPFQIGGDEAAVCGDAPVWESNTMLSDLFPACRVPNGV